MRVRTQEGSSKQVGSNGAGVHKAPPRLGSFRCVHAAALGGIVLWGCGGSDAPLPPLPCTLDLVQELDLGATLGHLDVLSGEIGARVASSPEERAAADYIASVLEGFGYDVQIQTFPRPGLAARLDVHGAEGAEGFKVHPAVGRLQGVGVAEYSLLTPETGIRAPLVDCGGLAVAGGGCVSDVTGAFALLTPAEGVSAEELLERAAAAGALGAVVHGEGWQRYGVTVPSASIPFVAVNGEAGERLRDLAPIDITLRVGRYETSQNVIATRGPGAGAGSDTTGVAAPVVVFSAHYDSVEQSPGANDNGTGTSGLLELARILARVETPFELRFAAVGAEEVGLQGARFFVAALPESERARIVANFNMDMIGTAGPLQTQLFVNTLDGDNLVAQSARAASAGLGFPEDLLRAPYQRGASDHVAFHDVGIPAANFIWRDPETINLEPWYHHPHDRIENVSPDRMQTALSIVLGAATEVICEAAEGL